MADTVDSKTPEVKLPEKPAVSFSIWPPTDRTREAVTNRLIETLSAPSVLSKRYGTIPREDALATARRIEEEAFAVAAASASTNDDGIEILQVYSKEISKRMLEAVKSRSAPAPVEGTNAEASEEASGDVIATTSANPRWFPPKEGIFKVNFSGALFTDSSCSGIGVIIRDHEGQCVAALSQKVHQLVSAEYIETLAACRAVKFAIECSFRDIHLEGNERNVIQAIKADDDKNMLAIGGVIGETKSLLSKVSCADISLIGRKCNGVACSLAEYAIKVDDYVVWLEEVPDFVTLDVVE